MRPSGFHIRRGFALVERRRAAEIYWQAFGAKLANVLGPEARAVRFLGRGLRADHCFSACDDDGQVIGLAGFKTVKGSFSGGTVEDLRGVYGAYGAWWRLTLFRFFATEVDNERFLIDGIAVAPSWRGRGVGRALVQALCEEARTRGYDAVRLEVAEENVDARRLYEREGFTALRTDRMGLLRFVFGFRAAVIMVRDLSPNAAFGAGASVLTGRAADVAEGFCPPQRRGGL